MIKLPINTADIISKMRKHARAHFYSHGQYPTFDESAAYMDIPKEQLERLVKMSTAVTSLNFQSQETDNEIIDLVHDETAETPLAVVDKVESVRRVRKAVTTLPEDERKMIQNYYGLDGRPSVTLGDIADHRSVSREAIRQRVLRINNKLRYQLASRNL